MGFKIIHVKGLAHHMFNKWYFPQLRTLVPQQPNDFFQIAHPLQRDYGLKKEKKEVKNYSLQEESGL